MGHYDRRSFLQSAVAGGALAGLADFTFLQGLRPVSADEARLDPRAVQLDPEIEPLVRLLEDTPREKLIEQVADRVRRGLGYRELLAALLLAGVRNVQPRPSVGYKFHAVLVVNSAHLASLSSPDRDRWLPVFWAIDYFKSSQAADEREGNWTMPPVDESAVPPAHRAEAAFIEAMEQWDEAAADVAAASLARHLPAHRVFQLFARFAARDFRSIGHKAIFVANSWRTLQCIGWHHAEPVLRSLAYALLNHQGEPNPATSDLDADRPWRENQQRVERIAKRWSQGKLDAEAARQMLVTLRDGSAADAAEQVVDLLEADISPRSIYDGLFLGSGELLMRQPAIVALHAVTTTNAAWYAFQMTDDDRARRLLLLQNAAFLPLFREGMRRRGAVGNERIDQLEPAETKLAGEPLVEDVFRQVSDNPMEASKLVLRGLASDISAETLIQAARRMVFLKGNDAHDYKFSSAVLEDYYHVTPAWRNHFLASSVFKLCGAGERDNPLVQRIREAIQTV